MSALSSRGQNTWLAARFLLLHLAALSVFAVPFTPSLLAWLAASYVVRMFGVTAGYHRYFSHRSYQLGRAAQLAMAVLAQTSGQKGVLWWAAHHRDHHRHADRPEDVHSPRHGWWWSHVGWLLSTGRDHYDPLRVADFGRYPELRWLDRFHSVPLRERFHERIAEVHALGFDARFARMWDLYLGYCEAAFQDGHIGNMQLLLTKSAAPSWLPSIRSTDDTTNRIHAHLTIGDRAVC